MFDAKGQVVWSQKPGAYLLGSMELSLGVDE
jgi:hypothetical protein